MRNASRKAYHYIYKTVCTVTSEFYIGMHSTDDLDDDYIGSGQKLWKSIKRHGRENHKCEILEFLFDRESLRIRERELVNGSLLKEDLCMNLAYGGQGWAFPTEETRRKISLAQKGKKLSPEHVRRCAEARRGKKRSEETKCRISESLRGQEKSITARMNMSKAKKQNPTRYWVGKKRSQETKRKISEALKGRSQK